ncbi:MAG: glutamate--tRNA ligase family protein [Verrucomicrobia bacterium]|nr:glutamate--tRNA ligase family protein [Verrucomicrobiota bacterium]
MNKNNHSSNYRGRIAPTPTGLLHLGHASTFLRAWQRAQSGTLILRIEDLDRQRCKPEFSSSAIADLHWLGIHWQQGPDVGGPADSYIQSERMHHYVSAWHTLRAGGFIYPSPHSRSDVARALSAPHPGESEAIFPIALRPTMNCDSFPRQPDGVNWRFRVPDHRKVTFSDGRCGSCTFTAGIDFGDFLVWRKDGFPAYELAVVVDDYLMGITEVVRGEDLLLSTARQILLYEALRAPAPAWFHCPLLCDANGQRLAKRNHALSLQTMRTQGMLPRQIIDRIREMVPGAGIEPATLGL